jgi:hypothetical protein
VSGRGASTWAGSITSSSVCEIAARLADDSLPVRVVAGERAGIAALAIATTSGTPVELRF